MFGISLPYYLGKLLLGRGRRSIL